jgi:hypothetical protein
LHDGSPATDSKCVQYSLKKGIELLTTTTYANLVTCTRLNKMLQLDLNNKKDGGSKKKDGSSWTLDDCGRPNHSWSDNCVLLFLKNMFAGDDESYFEWHRLRSNQFSELCPDTDPDPDFKPDTVYLVVRRIVVIVRAHRLSALSHAFTRPSNRIQQSPSTAYLRPPLCLRPPCRRARTSS